MVNLCLNLVYTQTMAAYYRIIQSTMDPHVWDIFFLIVCKQTMATLIILWYNTVQPTLNPAYTTVQTQTTAAYCRILPTLKYHVWDIFFR
jgi:hypothetical protein